MEQSLTEGLRETLAVFEDPGVPKTTPEVTERLDLGRRAVYGRLERLVEAGMLETKKVGANARVWWRPATDVDAPVETILDDVDVGIFVLDEEFDVAWINDATERYFRLDREQVLGADKRQLIEEHVGPRVADTERFTDTVLETYDDNTHTERFECAVTGDDETRWLEHYSKPIETGTYAGGRVELYYDVTERKQTERARQTDRDSFESLLGAVDEYAIFTLDTDGYVQNWNPGAERIKGYDEAEIVGEHFSTFYTESDRAADVPEENLAAAAEAGSVQDEGWRLRKDGSRFWANVTITAIRDDDGDLEGYAKVTRDMTDRLEREQRLREEKAFVESIFENQRDIIYTFDTSGTFLRWNDRFREVTEYTDGEIEAMQPTDFIAEDDATAVAEAIERVFDGENVVIEASLQTATGEEIPYEFAGAPLTDEDGAIVGLTGIGRDISERKAKERQLEQRRDALKRELDDVFTRIDDGFFALDDDWQFVHVNEQAESFLGYDAEELIGRTIWEAFPEAVDSTFQTEYERAVETQDSVRFEEYYPPLDGWFEVSAYPSESGLSVYFRDITDRIERESELERYENIMETVADGIYVLDSNHRFVTINEAFASLTGYDRDTLLGRHAETTFGTKFLDVERRKLDDLQDNESEVAVLEEEVFTADGTPVIVESRFRKIDFRNGETGRVGVVRDVTDRVERERELELYATIAETIPDGVYALDEDDRFIVVNEGFCDLSGYSREELLGEHPTLVNSAAVNDQANVLEDAIAAGERDEATLEFDLQTADGELIPVEGHFSPYSYGDVSGRCGVVRDMTEHVERERELERQREQLAALNNLNDVIHRITEAVIHQSTREEIEATVCERLVDSDSYLFAWVGDADATTQTVSLRTEAGVEGYLDDITISVDPDDETSNGPTGRAFRTGETQVTHDVEADSRFDPWRGQIEQYGFRSSAAIPIVHDQTIYGVLNVYSERTEAFEGDEREVITHLGEVVGHAIAATERKQALMSDELVELEFQIDDVFSTLDIPTGTCGKITLDDTVPLDDDTFLVYGTATPEAMDTVTQLTDSLPNWDDVTVRSEGDPIHFELRLTDPPVLSVVASFGGYVDTAVIEDGDYQMTIHLAPTVDPRTVIEAVQEAYPSATMLSLRQITRERDEFQHLRQHFETDLTDRQRTALRAAYHAGFFEWPRDATGEEIAESLGVAPPTFHQHLRKGQQKMFDTVFSLLRQ